MSAMALRSLVWLAWRRVRRDLSASIALCVLSVLAAASLAAVPTFDNAMRDLALHQALAA